MARLVQPGLRKAMQRPEHSCRAEVDAVNDVWITGLRVERMPRPPVPVAQRRVGFVRDRPDLRLDLRRAPCRVQQRLMSACVEHRDPTLTSAGEPHSERGAGSGWVSSDGDAAVPPARGARLGEGQRPTRTLAVG
jgi:hypothetical protein